VTTIGVVAGSGRLPAIFADVARSQGDRVIGIGLKGVTDESFASRVDKMVWVDLGAIQKTVFSLLTDRIKKMVLLGKLGKDFFFNRETELDQDTRRIIEKVGDRKDYSMLGEAERFLGKFGIEILDPTEYMRDLIPAKGVITKRAPSEEESGDISCALEVARSMAGLDIGQTVAVRNRTVIAIEAVEGTDETIRRAGRYSNKGFVAAKVARPKQDMRFDVPLVGLETVTALAESGATAFALESGRMFLIDREEIVKLADSKDLAIAVV
jgi:DUF1009 family protein